MIDLGILVLLRPFWLAAVPAALLLSVVSARRADGGAKWRRLIDPALMPALHRLGRVTEGRRGPRPWLLGAAACFLTLALAGPATQDPDAPVLRNLDAVMILLDLSPSMTEGGGLDDAQAAVSRLISAHGTRPIGLGVFAGESFLVSVPTEETESLQTAVAVVNAEIMPVAGSRPDRALAMAQSALRDAAAANPDVVLVSDGGGVGPEAVDLARQMRAEAIRISAIFVAPDAPPYGLPPARPKALAKLVEAGGGVLAEPDDLSVLEDRLGERRGTAGVDAARRSLPFLDHGPWLLALALAALLPTYRRRRTE